MPVPDLQFRPWARSHIARRLAVAALACLSPSLFPSSLAAQEPAATPPQGLRPRVILLAPQVSLDVLQPNSKTQGIDNAAFEQLLTETARTHLQAQNFTPVDPASLQSPIVADSLSQLEPLRSRLARGLVNDDARTAFARLAAQPGDDLILVQFVHFKEGPGGSWDPNTGAITSQMSSTLIQIALISPRSAAVLWKSEEFERKVYRANDAKFVRMLDQLYATLVGAGEIR